MAWVDTHGEQNNAGLETSAKRRVEAGTGDLAEVAAEVEASSIMSKKRRTTLQTRRNPKSRIVVTGPNVCHSRDPVSNLPDECKPDNRDGVLSSDQQRPIRDLARHNRHMLQNRVSYSNSFLVTCIDRNFLFCLPAMNTYLCVDELLRG